MAKAYAHSVPGALAEAGSVLNSEFQKDKEGKRLIQKFCKQRQPSKLDKRRRVLPGDDPADAAKLYAYNIRDIQTQDTISCMLPDLSTEEQELWFVNQAINTRGVHIDVDALADCEAIVAQATNRYQQELQELTGGYIKSEGELQKINALLLAYGAQLPSLDKDDIKHALKNLPLNPTCTRILEIRQILSAQSVKKVDAIRRRLCADGRIHDLFEFCGADRTGRFAGRGPQPQNLPSGGPRPDWNHEQVEQALELISYRNLQTVEGMYGDALKTVSGCLRALFCAAPGKELICSDYSAIEAVVLAVLAGEQWRLDVFNSHGKIYEQSASKITGVSFEEFMCHKEETDDHHPMRKLGKVAELASGYQGWIGAWKNFGADKHFDNDDQIKRAILAWRAESPAIVELWGGQWRKHPDRWEFTPELYGLEGAAISAALNPGQAYAYRLLTYLVKDDILYCRLPSGRCLKYHQPRLTPATDRYSQNPIHQLSYMGYNRNSMMGPYGWVRLTTYGGKLAENATQATARDILTYAMPRVEVAGYPIVLHVHDELVCEVSQGWGSVEELETIMSTMPPWAQGWPVKARGGWRGQRYRKD
jgi:DNA polymerase